MDKRIERDTMGEVKVEEDKLWGAQTQRSVENFPIGNEKMPKPLIESFILLKRSAAVANYKLNQLSREKKEAILQACDELLNQPDLLKHFPLSVWQTGSGTQTNMNTNEVLTRLGNQYLKEGQLHPNDDLNKSQSSNDTFPTAMHMASVRVIENDLMPALQVIKQTLLEKMRSYQEVVKIGRTHLQDATPLTLAQEISAWVHMIEKVESMLANDLLYLREVPIGGTAVGTGINAPDDFDRVITAELTDQLGTEFIPTPNKFHGLTSHDQIVRAHGTLKALAGDLMKMANDIRYLSSGPRAGYGEMSIPANEPGSSVMPGKVNPTQAEALTMISVQVMGNDTAIGVAASQGQFQLNVYKPVIIHNFLQSVRLLTDGIHSFNERCLMGLAPVESKIQENLERSLMLVTALNPYIGYENAAKIAKKAYEDNLSLKQAAVKLELVSEEQFDQWVNPQNMI
ncbi:fumarase, class II [Pelagirhabdus alkalitolerans]|uniref:Fumarate hydratase class II n=1 Tax=Pelagirhabdus alkalitolerans TaxID=1612202 RepID=A0A1G6N684_9BACI|nr:class II fumarate hydratase [Pelagirhabdus alkalitolerans]SDC62635.1 fumarase, class II [Pelagirhabdus alkalitolerans]